MAYVQLVLPEPTIGRSPDEALVWDRNGMPFTYVNLWTWFFTDPGTFEEQSLRLDAFGAWGEVYAEPTVLTFTPGDGGASVSCEGPGRDWTEADGDDPPPGGCGYIYRHAAESVTSTVSIEWHVTWAGSDGSGGTYPPMVTEASSTFTVLQVQVVNR